MKKALFALAIAAVCACTTDPTDATRALEDEGYTEVRTGGASFFGCGKGDYMGREFTAKNVNGRTVSGVVCCGLTKGCTVRH